MHRRRFLLAATVTAAATAIGVGATMPSGQAQTSTAIGGYDAVSYQTGRPVRGDQRFALVHEGQTFLFASAENRDRFKADPARYAPQYGGFCAFAASRGYVAPGDPQVFQVVDGRLYLQFNRRALSLWQEDIGANIRKGDQNWPRIRPN